jgi:hypothetical protein
LQADKKLKGKHEDIFNTINLLLTHGYLLKGDKAKALDSLKTLDNSGDLRLRLASQDILSQILKH